MSIYRWLAHDSVEEDLTAKYGLLPWALQTNDGRPSVDLKNDFKRFLTKKNDLWTRMGFRARVTKDECDEVNIIFFFILIIYFIKRLCLFNQIIGFGKENDQVIIIKKCLF